MRQMGWGVEKKANGMAGTDGTRVSRMARLEIDGVVVGWRQVGSLWWVFADRDSWAWICTYAS